MQQDIPSSQSFEHPTPSNATLPHLEPLPRLHRPPPLLRLTPIRPSSLDLLIPTQTRAQADIDARRRVEPKALGHLDEVEFVHVEDAA